MRPLLHPAEMSAADAATVAAGTAVEELMDRAGRALAREVIALAGVRYGLKVAVVCGKGANGGDGFAAARHLRREGVGVVCLLTSPLEAIQDAARVHAERARRQGVPVRDFDASALPSASIVVDAYLGTGVSGPLRSEAADVVRAINRWGKPVVSADLPSGIDAATGGGAVGVRASVTVAMGGEKIGTAVYPGSVHAGRVVVAPIGIAIPPVSTWRVEDPDVDGVLSPRDPGAHKRTSGHVAVWAGSEDMPGAAALTCRGAFAAGAGYVSLVSTARAAGGVVSAIPEVVAVGREDTEVLGPPSFEKHKELLQRVAAVAVGPGLGRGEQQRALVASLLVASRRPMVVDADALHALASLDVRGEDLAAPMVLTPHVGELGLLLDMPAEEIVRDRPAAARMAARHSGAVVILKGPRSMVAAPDGRVAVVTAGGPELATAGTGDVLSGVLAALLARGLEPWSAAWAAAHIHARAGERAQAATPRAITASDVAAHIEARTTGLGRG